MSLRSRLAAIACVALSPAALAFPIMSAPPADTVVEFFNHVTGHYFYSWSPNDQQALESGAFGAGWVRTGQGFGAYGTRERGAALGYAGHGCASATDCLPITRFYAPGPNSHFFTGSANDISILDQPGTGWYREGVAFFTRMPAALGSCPEGTPVRRLYNNRAPFNDTNHRYTADDAARQLMAERGWIDEGVAFCAHGKRTVLLETHAFTVPTPAEVTDMRACRSAAGAGSCLGMTNLPVPSITFDSNLGFGEQDEFHRHTGVGQARTTRILAVSGDSPAAAATDAFVQLSSAPASFPATGIHVATRSRLGGPYAAITALRRLDAGALHPFRFDTGTPRELYLRADVTVQEVMAAAGSHAYGVVAMQFTDATSGRSFLFHMLAFGTLPAGDDGVGRDAHTLLPMVHSRFGTDGRFGRLVGSYPWGSPHPMAPPFVGSVEATIQPRHFAAMLQAARQVDPALSPRAEDYFVANFGLVNETFGEGEIGLALLSLTLQLKGAE